MDSRLAAYVAVLPPQPGQGLADSLDVNVWPQVSFWQQMRAAGLVSRLGALLGTHALEIALLFGSWAFLGSGALSGRLDYAWLAAWALCLASTVPLRATSRWLEGVVAVGFGGLLKQRLMVGAMTMDADLMRRKGAGELLSEVLESEAIEQLGASGGLQILLAALELLLAPFVIGFGAAARNEIMLLIFWIALCAFLISQNVRRRFSWTRKRLGLTHQLVEKMSAHRTRLAQQAPSEWHREEDRETEQYSRMSETLDRSSAWIETALPRSYVIAAFAVLAPSFLSGSASLAQLAISFGAILFTSAAIERLTAWLAPGTAAWIAWRNVKVMFDAAAAADRAELPPESSSISDTILQAHNVMFTHQGRYEPILKGCSLAIERGDFVLLQGDSGSGKSTLVSLLGGLRRPSGGLLLAGGLDRRTLGEATWRRRIAVAPQYHENHVFTAPLSFNLLLGRPYPHSAQDLEEAKQLCHELGLGPLLERMPAGLDQIVGETGWQLSQGERGRVFLARALLQNAEAVMLDESLGALDPQNLRQCLDCVTRRAETLLVVAHP
ncbi:MAG: ATP-binding cassette domain-containing protein [Terriglobales bacterium]